MNKLRKILMLVCMMAMVVCISVGATIAYLTSQDTVTNTFTVGQVGITLDEAKVNTDGTLVTGNDAARVDNNEYHLLPGHTYTKDPTVHVNENSESCWLFVRVENDIAEWEIEATSKDDPNYKTIKEQMTANGWQTLDEENYSNLYYQEYVKGKNGLDFVVFEEFMISGEADNAAIGNLAPYETDDPDGEAGETMTAYRQITVTAYAIQRDGFDNPATAWEAGNWD